MLPCGICLPNVKCVDALSRPSSQVEELYPIFGKRKRVYQVNHGLWKNVTFVNRFYVTIGSWQTLTNYIMSKCIRVKAISSGQCSCSESQLSQLERVVTSNEIGGCYARLGLFSRIILVWVWGSGAAKLNSWFEEFWVTLDAGKSWWVPSEII